MESNDITHMLRLEAESQPVVLGLREKNIITYTQHNVFRIFFLSYDIQSFRNDSCVQKRQIFALHDDDDGGGRKHESVVPHEP